MNEELLIKYIKHRCSVGERTAVREWLSQSLENQKRLYEMEQVYALSIEAKYSDEQRLNQAYSQLQGRLKQGMTPVQPVTPHRFKLWDKSWLKYAAAILVIISISLNLIFISSPEEDAFTTVFVPNGQRVSLVLSDGSKVWLNSESRFRYPNKFSKKNRHVELDGEGYFEIAKDKDSPFSLSLPELNIRVLGTKFNAKGYTGEPSSVALKEGSVEVSTTDNRHRELMEPNDMVLYTKRNGLVLLRNKSVRQMDSWTTGDLFFDNQQLKAMVPTIERRYDVKIHIMNSELSEERFTCHFRKDLNIHQALNILKATKSLNYKIKGSEIYIYK